MVEGGDGRSPVLLADDSLLCPDFPLVQVLTDMIVCILLLVYFYFQ